MVGVSTITTQVVALCPRRASTRHAVLHQHKSHTILAVVLAIGKRALSVNVDSSLRTITPLRRGLNSTYRNKAIQDILDLVRHDILIDRTTIILSAANMIPRIALHITIQWLVRLYLHRVVVVDGYHSYVFAMPFERAFHLVHTKGAVAAPRACILLNDGEQLGLVHNRYHLARGTVVCQFVRVTVHLLDDDGQPFHPLCVAGLQIQVYRPASHIIGYRKILGSLAGHLAVHQQGILDKRDRVFTHILNANRKSLRTVLSYINCTKI